MSVKTGRPKLFIDDLQWKKDELQWNTTFDERHPSVQDNLRWKTTFCGRQPSVEDDLH